MPDDELLFPEFHAARYGNGRRRQRLILPKKLTQAAGDLRLAGAERDAAHAILLKWADLESSGRLTRMNETQGRDATETGGYRTAELILAEYDRPRM